MLLHRPLRSGQVDGAPPGDQTATRRRIPPALARFAASVEAGRVQVLPAAVFARHPAGGAAVDALPALAAVRQRHPPADGDIDLRRGPREGRPVPAQVRPPRAAVVRHRERVIQHAPTDAHGYVGGELGPAVGDVGVHVQRRQQAPAGAVQRHPADAEAHHEAVPRAAPTAPGRRRGDGQLARRQPDAVPAADGRHPARQGHRAVVERLQGHRAGVPAHADGAGAHGGRTAPGRRPDRPRGRLLRPVHGRREAVHDVFVRRRHEARRLHRHHAGPASGDRADTEVRRADAVVHVHGAVHVPARVRRHHAQAARAQELAGVRRLRRDGPAQLPAERRRRGLHVRVLPGEHPREVHHRRADEQLRVRAATSGVRVRCARDAPEGVLSSVSVGSRLVPIWSRETEALHAKML